MIKYLPVLLLKYMVEKSVLLIIKLRLKKAKYVNKNRFTKRRNI